MPCQKYSCRLKFARSTHANIYSYVEFARMTHAKKLPEVLVPCQKYSCMYKKNICPPLLNNEPTVEHAA